MRNRRSPVVRTKLRLASLLLLAHGAAAAAEGAAATPLQPALLDVSVNGQRSPEPFLFLQDGEGVIYAREAALREWRIYLPAPETIERDGETWHRIDNVASLRATLSPQEQALTIQAGPEMFERQRASLAPANQVEMTPAGTGGFMNYDLFVEYAGGAANLNGAFEIGTFTSKGVGVSSFIAGVGAGPERLIRLESSWIIDRPSSLSSIRIGDGISSTGPGSVPVRFGGVQYARNFAVQPGFITMPLPILEGSAAVPSVIDVYVNNALQGSRDVNPGPFEISNVPVQSGGGTVQLVVHDLLGREVIAEQSYYASSLMLRRGLHDFSYEAGFLRRGFGVKSNRYGSLMASTTHRYGLTNSMTGEAHLQASRSVQMAGAAVTTSVSNQALVGISASLSNSPQGAGFRVAGSAERRTAGLSFGIRSEYASRDFAFIGISADQGVARMTTQGFVDLPILGGGLGVNFIHRDNRGRPDETFAGMFASRAVTRTASAQFYVRRVVAGERNTSVGFSLAVALGGGRSIAASSEHKRGANRGHVSYQSDAPPGIGSGYRVAASVGDGSSVEGAYVQNLRSASLGARVGHANGRTGLRLSAAGGVGLIDNQLFASRTLGTSFAAVHVGDYEGVRVYADNQLVGVTNKHGTAIIPAMRAFERNLVRIDEGDLPMDVQLAHSEVAVRPFARTGAIVNFEPRRERGVLMQIRLDDGTSLPAGAIVRVEGDASAYVAVSGGEVYVPAMRGSARLRATWGDRRCEFDAVVPDDDDPQPRLEALICRSATHYAAR